MTVLSFQDGDVHEEDFVSLVTFNCMSFDDLNVDGVNNNGGT